ncbi:TadE/TadG family type IV pilus assembly protein [Puniceibacterium sp. IMCC21224]|uniref:TadE/TadG family type IV pilus assembly protein n=1 Tax=Puniceibacterium sp. IMCC21224 TaxID=1618204 RepID=UPI00064DB480|nr:TadE family protein [Puniceibacterium sp. IMCC21224]KMK65566.1 TadE-like protein [Puniceibacterium sp. IMCC21224]
MLSNFLKRFCRSADGSSTVEFALWFPFILFFMMGSTDLVMLFYNQQMLYEDAYNGSRQVSLGIHTAEEAEQQIAEREASRDGLEVEITSEDGYVTSVIRVPVESVAVFLNHVLPGTLEARSTMWIEVVAAPEDM